MGKKHLPYLGRDGEWSPWEFPLRCSTSSAVCSPVHSRVKYFVVNEMGLGVRRKVTFRYESRYILMKVELGAVAIN